MLLATQARRAELQQLCLYKVRSLTREQSELSKVALFFFTFVFIPPIIGIIEPSTDDTQVYAAVGSAANLPCVFSSGLTHVNVVWERLTAGSLLKSTPDRLPPSFSPSSAHSPMDNSVSSKEVGFEDAGRYRCAGTVDKQRLTRSMQLVIAKSKFERSLIFV